MPGDGIYDHVIAVIGCHGGQTIRKLAIGRFPLAAGNRACALGTAVFSNMQPLDTKAHLSRGRIFACGWRQEVKNEFQL